MPENNQKNIVLAGLSAAGQNATFSPVQTQKLFFIIDREIAHLIGGTKFNFRPYDYGPFDKSVYETLEELEKEDKVQINDLGRYSRYSLTSTGFELGIQELEGFPLNAREFISGTARWVQALSFEELVASIYKKYPDMKANSIFRS